VPLHLRAGVGSSGVADYSDTDPPLWVEVRLPLSDPKRASISLLIHSLISEDGGRPNAFSSKLLNDLSKYLAARFKFQTSLADSAMRGIQTCLVRGLPTGVSCSGRHDTTCCAHTG
jgi:hypothetical protein